MWLKHLKRFKNHESGIRSEDLNSTRLEADFHLCHPRPNLYYSVVARNELLRKKYIYLETILKMVSLNLTRKADVSYRPCIDLISYS